MGASKGEIIEFFAQEFPKSRIRVDEVGGGCAAVSHEVGPDDLRPGATVFGPLLMTVADVSLYAAILGEIGIVPLAVTTNLTINFMRRPAAGRRIMGRCKLLKVGKRQAVGEVLLYSEGDPAVVAHAIGTYAIPPRAPAIC